MAVPRLPPGGFPWTPFTRDNLPPAALASVMKSSQPLIKPFRSQKTEQNSLRVPVCAAGHCLLPTHIALQPVPPGSVTGPPALPLLVLLSGNQPQLDSLPHRPRFSLKSCPCSTPRCILLDEITFRLGVYVSRLHSRIFLFRSHGNTDLWALPGRSPNTWPRLQTLETFPPINVCEISLQ